MLKLSSVARFKAVKDSLVDEIACIYFCVIGFYFLHTVAILDDFFIDSTGRMPMLRF